MYTSMPTWLAAYLLASRKSRAGVCPAPSPGVSGKITWFTAARAPMIFIMAGSKFAGSQTAGMLKMIFRRCLLKFGVRRTSSCETGVSVTGSAFRMSGAGLLLLHPFVSPISDASCHLQFRYAYHSFTISDQFKSASPTAMYFCNIALYSFSDISSSDSASW